MTADPLHPVTLILLAEAHGAVPVPLCHAGVVDHEEVDLKMLWASSSNLVVMSAYVLDHFYTAAFTGGGGGHPGLKSNQNFMERKLYKINFKREKNNIFVIA
jgi:hypothetical protein